MIDGPPTTSTSSTTPPSQQPKLTKKRKKALAFRDKISKKSSTVRKDEQEIEMEDFHVPVVEKPARSRHAGASLQNGDVEEQKSKSTSRRSKETDESKKRPLGDTLSSLQEVKADLEFSQQQTSRQKRKGVSQVGDQQRSGDSNGQDKKLSKKRKREQLDDELDKVGRDGREGDTEKKTSNKKRKREKAESGVDGAEEEGEGEEMSAEEERKEGREKQRFILFIGNLKYTTSVDTIQSHFSVCDPPPEVRLLTPKASAAGKSTPKSKGCAFLEFQNKAALQSALKLHHSMLEGRMINVELTAGGGGKSEKRMEKLRERNKELLGQRKKKVDKGKKASSLPSKPDKPHRYSATSGIEQSSPKEKRTWTVGNAAEDKVHRGGQRHKKSERTRGSRKSKDWGTGVNAIPVG